MPNVDQDRLRDLRERFVADFGATLQAANVVIGDRLGLYAGLAALGPSTPRELAAATATHERYVGEWLLGQVAGGYVSRQPESGRFFLSAEQALLLANEAGPLSVPGAFQLATACVKDEAALAEAFLTGDGVPWHQHHEDVFEGCERFSRSLYGADLVSNWIPLLDGVMEKLGAGARVADVGCGHGAPALMMARAFPESIFVGFDCHVRSVEWAGKTAAFAGLADRVSFEVASTHDFPGRDYDLVTTFHCLHDLGDPIGAARHIRSALVPGGTWMIVEPYATDSVDGNLTPLGRAFYNLSTLLCVPSALSQKGGMALGAQAGEAKLRRVVQAGGFTSVRKVTASDFNLVLEARA
ncbi:MAG: class I SAM-dependent methyltransferase [Acidimicrobiales bacterium]